MVVYIERGMRRIPVQYAKRMAGRRMFAGQATYFPMKVNTSGVIPPIFAGALLVVPGHAGQLAAVPERAAARRSSANSWLYNGLFVLLIIFFTYFYTALTFRPDDVADNIKKQGGYIPGIRPGRQTAEYIERVLNRITFGGAIYLAVDLRHPLRHLQRARRAASLRRHRAAHRRRRGAGHGAADRGPPHQPQLRGLRRSTRAAHPRPCRGGLSPAMAASPGSGAPLVVEGESSV